MPVEVRHSPPLHRPGDVTTRPRGILKNPSFSGPSGGLSSPAMTGEDTPSLPPSTPLDPQEAKELTIQNTLQNAGHRRSSSAARASATRRHSSTPGEAHDEDQEKARLKWDEANLFLAEQQSGGRMKIDEPKTPFQHGDAMAEEDEEEEDVAIDPRYVNVDEVDMQNKGSRKKQHKEHDIPGLDIGEAEGEAVGASVDNDRIIRSSSLSRENSKDKHVSVSEGSAAPTQDELEKHKHFEEQRKKHYEMRSVKDLLGHPEDIDVDEDDEAISPSAQRPSGVNGA